MDGQNVRIRPIGSPQTIHCAMERVYGFGTVIWLSSTEVFKHRVSERKAIRYDRVLKYDFF
jgi:hypothetical protein